MIGDPTRLVIRRNFPRLPRTVLETFGARSTSFVADAQQGRGALDFGIKPLEPTMRFVGTALTVNAGARDNLAMLAALDLIQPGDVPVVSTQNFTATAMIGDNVVKIAKARGAPAIVTDGCVRDVAEILEIGLPIFCRGVTPATAFANGPGEVGLPIAMGEVAVRSGDLVLGDRDGVLIVAKERIEEIAARLEEVARKEADIHRRIMGGEITSLLMQLRPGIKEEITYVD
jgi:4-hydroxy-4-methyl-2-oxoglutarate aldolase